MPLSAERIIQLQGHKGDTWIIGVKSPWSNTPVSDQSYPFIFEYLLTLENCTISEKEEIAIAYIKERRLHDYYFDQDLQALNDFNFVFVHMHPFWGCGQTQEQYDTSEDYPGANMWGYCLNKIVKSCT